MTSEKNRSGSLPRRTGTRARILVQSLELFNNKGPGRVTTAEIAQAASINEGNLYYYFRTKESLLLALFSRFEEAAANVVARAKADPPHLPSTYSGFLQQWFSLVWSYRFLFRDILDVVATAPALQVPISNVSTRLRHAVEDVISMMERAGLISLPQPERQSLLANVWIVSTYWAAYLGLQEGVLDLTHHHLAWGLNQVASLFRPYLSAEARHDLDQMLNLPIAKAPDKP